MNWLHTVILIQVRQKLELQKYLDNNQSFLASELLRNPKLVIN